MVTYSGAKVVKRRNIKNCLFNKTYQWMRDKMLYWTNENEKIDGQNKLFDLGNHIEGVSHLREGGFSPYATKKIDPL